MLLRSGRILRQPDIPQIPLAQMANLENNLQIDQDIIPIVPIDHNLQPNIPIAQNLEQNNQADPIHNIQNLIQDVNNRIERVQITDEKPPYFYGRQDESPERC